MDVKEVRALKKQTEEKITLLLIDLGSVTGMTITDIDLDTTSFNCIDGNDLVKRTFIEGCKIKMSV